MVQFALVVFLVALAGGALPLVRRPGERALHAFLALATGVFLGAVFLHLLPELSLLEQQHHAGSDGAHGGGAEPHRHSSLWLFVLLGVMGVYLTESFLFRAHHHDDHHRHRAAAYHAALGLSIHSLTNGIGLAVNAGNSEVASVLFLSIVAHKSAEAFSLATLCQLAGLSRGRILVLLIAFCAVTPLGMALGHLARESLPPYGIGVLTALAAGTFLFVCLCELLPEVFHRREDSGLKLALLAAGVAAMYAIHEACA